MELNEQKRQELNSQELYGVVTQDIVPGRLGQVKFSGGWWSAKSGQDITINQGSVVKVVGRDNITLVVEPMDSFLFQPRQTQSPRHPANKRVLAMNVQLEKSSLVDEVAIELAHLCKALNAYHIACGGNGLEIDDWKPLVAVREVVEV